MKRDIASSYKTISVHQDRHTQIERYGRKGETFDDIIKRILKIYEVHKHEDIEEENNFSVDGKKKGLK